jgi:hypothetical protein
MNTTVHWRVQDLQVQEVPPHLIYEMADIAVYHQSQLLGLPLHNQYLTIPPLVVIEVDTKADLTQALTPLTYYHTKTDALLDFGMGNVLWFFTETEKVMIAERERDWITHDRDRAVPVLNDIAVNITQLLKASGL